MMPGILVIETQAASAVARVPQGEATPASLVHSDAAAPVLPAGCDAVDRGPTEITGRRRLARAGEARPRC